MAKKYDSTVARIAGNILSGTFTLEQLNEASQGGEGIYAVRGAVNIARAIVAEVQRTEPCTCNENAGRAVERTAGCAIHG